MRALIISQRGSAGAARQQLAYGSWYEAEDSLVGATDGDLLGLDRSLTHPSIRVRRAAGRSLRRISGGPRSIPPTRRLATGRANYDIAVFMPFSGWELPLLEELGSLRQIADRVVVYLPELWPVNVMDQRLEFEPWHLVDDIFVAIHPSVDLLAERLDRQVHYLPMAADVGRFRPASLDAPRPIDVLNIGRRIPELHDELLEWSMRTGSFYMYDTFRVATMVDAAAHRRDLGQKYQRSSIALCSYPKHDMPSNRGHRIIPQRLWEGLASGAVMIGKAPDDELQRIAVGEVVVDQLPEDPAQGVAEIEKLLSEDLTATRARNLDLALRSHDWSHRWRTMFRTLGMEEPEGVSQRIRNLANVADELVGDIDSTGETQ